VERRTPEVSRGRINGGDPARGGGRLCSPAWAGGVDEAKGAVHWEDQRAGYQTMEDQARMGHASRNRGIRSAGRAPLPRGGDPGQGGRALGVSPARTAGSPSRAKDKRPARPVIRKTAECAMG
jgi:hypothetical protein